jgi:PAS domain S-box-containing protein
MHETRLLPGTREGLESHRCFYRALVEQLPDAVTVIDEAGRILFTNTSGLRLLGYPLDDPAGRNAFDRIHPDDVARVKAAFDSTLRTDEGSVAVEYRCRRADGDWQVFEGTSRRSYDDTGAPIVITQARAAGALMSLNPRAHDEEALEAVARISAAIARDFNELLIELARHASALEAAGVPAARADARAMRQTLDRGYSLVDQLLVFDPREGSWEESQTDANELIEAMASDLERLPGEHGEITYLLGAAPARVALSRASLGVVLVAAVEHALLLSPRGRRLTIVTRNAARDNPAGATSGPFVVIEINNPGGVTGTIPIGDMFEPEPEPALHAADFIVRRAGGNLTATTDAITGTTVHLSLPISARS